MDIPQDQPSSSAYGGHGPALLAEIWVLTLIALVLVSLRVYMRLALDKGSSWSVYLAVVAWLFGLGATISMTVSIANGNGNHIITIVLAHRFAAAVEPFWISASFINLSLSAGKLSIIALLLDIQGRTHPIAKALLYSTGASNVIVYVIFVIVIFVQCQPSSDIWNLAVAIAGTCREGSRRALIMALFAGSWGAVTDLLLALYPTYLLFNVQIDQKIKLGVCILMGLGVLTAVCSSVKTAYFPVIEQGSDVTYHVAPLMAWGFAEMWVLIIASSIAPLWPLARRWHHHLSSLSVPKHSRPSAPSTANHTMPSSRPSWSGHRDRQYKQLVSSEAVHAPEAIDLADMPGRRAQPGDGKMREAATERSWV